MILRVVLFSVLLVGSNGQDLSGPLKGKTTADVAMAGPTSAVGSSGSTSGGLAAPKMKSNGLVPPSTPLATVRNTQIMVISDKKGCNSYITPYGVALRVCDATNIQLPVQVYGVDYLWSNGTVENYGGIPVCGIRFVTTDDPNLMNDVAVVYPKGLTNRPKTDPILTKEIFEFGFLLPAINSSVGPVPADIALASGWRECFNITEHPTYEADDYTIYDRVGATPAPTKTPQAIVYPKDTLEGSNIKNSVSEGTPAPTVNIDPDGSGAAAPDKGTRTISPASTTSPVSYLTTVVMVVVAAMMLRRW